MTNDDAFRVDSDEGREIVLDVIPTRLESDRAFSTVRVDGRHSRLAVRLRLSNGEAAELLELLEEQIGEWARERRSTLDAFMASSCGALDDLDDLSDPDHPRHAEALADNADWSRKAERESR